jgi:hypothetical protein
MCCLRLGPSLALTPHMLLSCCGMLQVLASIDGTPFMQPVAPGKLIVPAAAAAGGSVLVPGPDQAEVERLNKEVKESMQSHFD